jgi:hypothetical protein
MATFKHFTILLIQTLFVIGLTVPTIAADTNSPPVLQNSKTFIYSIKINGIGAGKIHTQITQDHQKFHIESVTKPNRLAGMLLGGNIVDNCSFSFNGEQQIVGESYSSSKKGKSSYGGRVLYDRRKHQLIFSQTASKENKMTPIPEGYLLDNCNFYAAVSLLDVEYLRDREIIVLDAKEQKFRGYRFESLENEVLDTRLGQLDTRKLTLVRSNNANRHLIFWLSDQYLLAPIQVVDQRKKRKVVEKLRSVTG